MKNRLGVLLACPALILLSSCADMGMYYPAGGFPAGGGPGPVVVDQVVGVGPYGPGGWSPGWSGGGWGSGWGWGGRPYYGGNYRCQRCNRNPCGCASNQHHHSGSRSSSSSSSSDRKYRIIAGDLDGKKKPNDFHSLDWYHSRGYSLENVKMETDRGAVIDKRPSSQRSSSSSSSRGGSSSSSSKSKSSSSSSGSRNVSTSKSKPTSIRDHIKSEYSKKK